MFITIEYVWLAGSLGFFGIWLVVFFLAKRESKKEMFVVSLGTMICRKDLLKKVLAGGIIFLALYFIFFAVFNRAFPGYIDQVWNFETISGIKFLGVPIEELLFALSLGMLWSGFYEHLTWRAVKRFGRNI